MPFFGVAALLGVAAILVGCGGAGGGKRATRPVTVNVSYKGAPVADATVTFISEEGEPSAAFGQTDSQGLARLQTPQLGDGAVLGKQKVVINKEQIVNNVKAADQDSPDYAPLPPGGAPLPQVKHLIPAKYTAPGTTTLSADVKPSGANDFKFELTD